MFFLLLFLFLHVDFSQCCGFVAQTRLRNSTTLALHRFEASVCASTFLRVAKFITNPPNMKTNQMHSNEMQLFIIFSVARHIHTHTFILARWFSIGFVDEGRGRRRRRGKRSSFNPFARCQVHLLRGSLMAQTITCNQLFKPIFEARTSALDSVEDTRTHSSPNSNARSVLRKQEPLEWHKRASWEILCLLGRLACFGRL